MSARRLRHGVAACVVVFGLVACGDRQERDVASSAAPAPAAASGARRERNRPEAAVTTVVPTSAATPQPGAASDGLLELAAIEVPAGTPVTERDIREALDAKRSELVRCVKESTTAVVTGKVMQSGSFQEVQVTKAQPEDVRVRDCLTAVLRTVRFSSVRSGEPAQVSLKLSLKGGGER